MWAIWFSADDLDNWTTSLGFLTQVDDTANWRTTETAFSVTWTVNRWMPKQERSVEYYTNEYRFSAGDTVIPYTYSYTTDLQYQKAFQPVVTIAGAMGGLMHSLVLTASTVLLLNSF